MEIQVSEDNFSSECVSFKNNLEKLKYEQNQAMVSRNDILLFVRFLIAIVTTGMLFHYIPKWKEKDTEKIDGDSIFGILLISFIVSVIAPLVFGWILPPPIEWFPQVFRDINQSQVDSWYNNIGPNKF